MYARNFVETDHSFFHPRIDDNAGGTGILVLEAPIMYYGMYLMSIPFGYQDWYGRLINLIVSSLGLYFFFLLVRRFYTDRVAFYATLILTTSLWLIFSRKTMQDTFAVSLMLMGLYCVFRFFDAGRVWAWLGYVNLIALGMLAKIPAGMYLIFPFLYLIRHRVKRKRVLWWGIGTLIPLILTYSWYFIYAPFASKRYGYWHNLGEPFRDGFQSLIRNMDHVVENFFFHSLHSFVFLGIFLWGWIWMIWKKQWTHLTVFGAFTALFGVYMIKSGTYFVQHNYYMIPYIPVMAVLIALTLTAIPRQKWAVILLLLGMTEGTSWVVRDFTNSPREEFKMKLISIVDEYTAPDDLIVLVNAGNPIGFYFAHRKGWMHGEEDRLPGEKLQELAERGARILIVNLHNRNDTYDLPVLYEDADYRVYRLAIDD